MSSHTEDAKEGSTGKVDSVSNTINALQSLQSATSATAVFPLLGRALSLVLDIVKGIQSKKEREKKRNARILTIATILTEVITQSTAGRNPTGTIASDELGLDDLLARTMEPLNNIRDCCSSKSKGQKLLAFMFSRRKDARLDEELDTLQNVITAFQMKLLMHTRLECHAQKQVMETQEEETASPVHIFRLTDIKLLSLCGQWPAQRNPLGDEILGNWNGRVVVVRRFRSSPTVTRNIDCAKLVHELSRVYHPYATQVLGYSHRSSPVKFYVLAADGISFSAHLQGKDLKAKLNILVDFVKDLQSTRSYFWMEFGFDNTLDQEDSCHLSNGGKLHEDENCLSTLRFNEHGKMVMAAHEFRYRSSACFLNKIQSQEGMAIDRGDHAGSSSPIDFDAAFLLMKQGAKMPYLEAFAQVIQPIRGVGHSQLQGKHFREANAFPGDYGYIAATTNSFVCLGHASQYTELDGDPFSIFTWGLPEQGREVEDHLTFRTWPTDVQRYVCGKPFEQYLCFMKYAVVLRPEVQRTFYMQVLRLSERHGIQPQKLVLIHKATYQWAVESCGQEGCPGCSPEDQTVDDGAPPIDEDAHQVNADQPYFYLRPLKDRRAQAPFGYWSMVPDPSPGPWPQLYCHCGNPNRFQTNVDFRYRTLTSLEVEILEYLRDNFTTETE